MRGNPQYRTQFLRRESATERQERKQNERQERKQSQRKEGRHEGRQTGRQRGRERERERESRRESAVGSFGDGCRGAQRALRHEGLGGKARHTGTDALYAVQLRFPSEDQSSQRVSQHYSGESHHGFLPRANHINSSEAPPTPSHHGFPPKIQ